MVLDVEADQAAYSPSGRGVRAYCVLKVRFILNEKFQTVSYEALPGKFVANKVYRNFIEVEKVDGKIRPKG